TYRASPLDVPRRRIRTSQPSVLERKLDLEAAREADPNGDPPLPADASWTAFYRRPAPRSGNPQIASIQPLRRRCADPWYRTDLSALTPGRPESSTQAPRSHTSR